MPHNYSPSAPALNRSAFRVSLFYILTVALVAWTAVPPVCAAEPAAETVAGWEVGLTSDQQVTLSAGGQTLLHNFSWLVQGRRDGRIKRLAGPAGAVKFSRQNAANETRLAMEPQKTELVEWQVNLRLGRRELTAEYQFRFLADAPDAWLILSAQVPENSGFNPAPGANGARQVIYHTKTGDLAFHYSPNELGLDPHRPYCQAGPRFFLGAEGEDLEKKAKRPLGFKAGDIFTASLRLTLPPVPGQTETASGGLAHMVQLNLAQGGEKQYWVYTPGETVKLNVPLTVKAQNPPVVTAMWSLTDYFGQTRELARQKLDLAEMTAKAQDFTFCAPAHFGPYRLTLELERILPAGQSEVVRKDVAILGVVDPRWAENRLPAEESFLGATIHGSREIRALARRFGFRWKRCEFEVMWTWNSPQPHEYTFTHEAMDWLKELDMRGYGQLTYCPWWAVEATPEEQAKVRDGKPNVHHFLSARPPRLDAFREYVQQAVSFFKNDLDYWELWNEPNVPIFWRGTPEQYLELLKITHEEVRRLDPGAKVVAPGGAGLVGLDGWGRKLLEAGAAKYVDVWSIHNYANDLYLDVEAKHSELRRLREVLKANGGENLELWNSEGGSSAASLLRDAEYPGWPRPEDRDAPDPRYGYALPKLFAVEMAEGIRKHFYYFFKAGQGYNDLCSGEGTGAPRFSLYPMAAWGGILDGSKYADRWTRDELGFAYFFSRGTDAAAMLWADLPAGASVPLTIAPAAGLTTYDALGNARPAAARELLSVAPLYLAWPGHTVAELQAALDWEHLPPLANPALQTERRGIPDLGLPKIADFNVAKEMAGSLHPIDLAPYCNMGLADPQAGDGQGGWSDEGPFNDFHGAPTSEMTIYGVPFRLIDPAINGGKSVISLKAETLPTGVEKAELPWGKPLRVIFLLHASQNYTDLTKGAAYEVVLHYADGQTRALEVTIPERLRDAWALPDPETEELAQTKAYPLPVAGKDRNMHAKEKAWMEKSGQDFIYRYPRVTYFENPYREGGAVTKIEIRSRTPHGVPIILAVTAG